MKMTFANLKTLSSFNLHDNAIKQRINTCKHLWRKALSKRHKNTISRPSPLY